jgi:hypothetical protein
LNQEALGAGGLILSRVLQLLVAEAESAYQAFRKYRGVTEA